MQEKLENIVHLFFFFFFQSWSAFSLGASKLTSKVADVGWKFTEVATRKVSEVSETVTERVNFFDNMYL